jgi:membrane protein implicated in regulation of membrane protease activity
MTVEIISIYFTGGALVSMALSLLGVPLEWQILTFCVVSIILIIFTRPIVARYLKRNESKTNVDTLIGDVATVTKEILPDERGEVKIKGQYWLAVSANNDTIELGSKVSILAIEGAKLIVKKYE